jgi:hypothetical protein
MTQRTLRLQRSFGVLVDLGALPSAATNPSPVDMRRGSRAGSTPDKCPSQGHLVCRISRWATQNE